MSKKTVSLIVVIALMLEYSGNFPNLGCFFKFQSQRLL